MVLYADSFWKILSMFIKEKWIRRVLGESWLERIMRLVPQKLWIDSSRARVEVLERAPCSERRTHDFAPNHLTGESGVVE